MITDSRISVRRVVAHVATFLWLVCLVWGAVYIQTGDRCQYRYAVTTCIWCALMAYQDFMLVDCASRDSTRFLDLRMKVAFRGWLMIFMVTTVGLIMGLSVKQGTCLEYYRSSSYEGEVVMFFVAVLAPLWLCALLILAGIMIAIFVGCTHRWRSTATEPQETTHLIATV